MPIARIFVRVASLIIVTCALLTGVSHVLGKIALQNTGIIYFVTQNEQYIFDPIRFIRYNLTQWQSITSTPFPSPDGLRIAFRQGVVDHSEIKIFDFATRETAVIYSQPFVGTFPIGTQIFSWSPSGRYLAFRGNDQLLKYDALTGAISQIIDEARGSFLNDANPNWSRDEAQIAFVSASRQTDNWQMYLVNGDGGDLRSINSADACAFFRPYWSPASENLIVLDASCDNIPTVFLLDVAAQQFMPFSDLATPTSSPVWSPDGSKILFIERTTSQMSRVYVFDVGRAQATHLTDGIAALWSPDGSNIVFSGNDGDLYTIQPDGGNRERLTFYNGSPFVYPVAWSR